MLHEGDGAGEQARSVDYDAVVLDLMLPGRSGFQVLRDIRARKAVLPVLMLTAKDSLEERVAGLDGGADDYMGKPFALAELSARIRALLRRGAPRETMLRVADLEMDTIRRKVPRAGRAVELKPKEYALLEYPDAQQRSAGDQVAHHRARLGHPLRQHQQRRRGPHQLAAQQDRPGLRRAADPHRPRRRLHADRHPARDAWRAHAAELSTRPCSALLLSALGFVSYRVLGAPARRPTPRRSRGDHQRASWLPAVRRRPADARVRPERRRAGPSSTRRPATTRSTTPTRDSCSRSRRIEPLGLHFTPARSAAFREQPRAVDIETDYGRFRISNSLVAAAAGRPICSRSARRSRAMDRALARFLDLLLVAGAGRAGAGGSGRRWMAGVALAPLSRLAAARRTIDITDLDIGCRCGYGRRTRRSRAGVQRDAGRLEHAVGEMRQFSAALAHELRTPLAVLRGEIEMASCEPGSPRARGAGWPASSRRSTR